MTNTSIDQQQPQAGEMRTEYRAVCAWVTEHGYLNAPMSDRARQLLHRYEATVTRQAEQIERLRPEVWQFALLMEEQLRKNDHKPGWKHDMPEALFRRLYDEVEELSEALRNRARFPKAEIGAEAADIGNFAMMIADVCDALAALEPG